MQDFRYLYYLTKAEGLGSVRIKKLLEHFGDAAGIFDAGAEQITRIDGFSSKSAEAILRTVNRFDSLAEDYDKLCGSAEKKNIEIITIGDELYPALLKEIYDPPVILYIRTNLGHDGIRALNNDSVGIVGTRKPSDYGKRMTETLAKELAQKGINIVSGFARGVDTYAHKSALTLKGNGTITACVFGCGVDVIYPPENKKLYDEVMDGGVMISEYEIGAKPDAVNFPKRNRIISGLTKGVVIIESAKDGGALITAHTALDQGREVFAVPGYVTAKTSEGTNYLIKSSQAKLVETVDDILAEIRRDSSAAFNDADDKQVLTLFPELAGNEKRIYELIAGSAEPVHIDYISENTELNISDCLVTLLNLEFKSLVNQLPGKRFSIVK